MNNNLSFFSGFTFTSIYTMTLFDAGMALFLGIIGGIGGMLGKELYYWVKKKKWK